MRSVSQVSDVCQPAASGWPWAAARSNHWRARSRFRGQAVAALVEETHAEFGEVEATLGSSAVMSETARRVGRRAGTGKERQTDPEACEEFRPARIVTGRRGVCGTRAADGIVQPTVGAGAENAGRRTLARVQHRRHGGCRGGSEQNGGVSLVALDCVASAVKVGRARATLVDRLPWPQRANVARLPCRCRQRLAQSGRGAR